MSILYHSGIGAPLWRAQFWAFERLASSDGAFGDLRVVIAALLSHLLNAAWKNTADRACEGARFASRLTAADTMVAAGGR
jgi:hypothetical protein